MDILSLPDEMKVYCLRAESFPGGVQKAHEQLHSRMTFSRERNYFGISRPDGRGSIEYKAAASEMVPGELSGKNLEEQVIRKGKYLYIDVQDFMKNIPSIGEAFQQLIHDKRTDPQGFCLEWYLNSNTCRCMVPMKEA